MAKQKNRHTSARWKRARITTEEENEVVRRASTVALKRECATALMFEMKNSLVEENWVVLEAILAILLKNTIDGTAALVISKSSAMRALAHVGPHRTSSDRDDAPILERIEKFAILFLGKLRDVCDRM